MSMSMRFKLGDKVAVVASDLSRCSGETGTVIGLVAPGYFSGDEAVVIKWDGPTAKGYERTVYRVSNLTYSSYSVAAQ